MSCRCDQSGLGALMSGVDQANLNNYVVSGSVIEWGGYLEKTSDSLTGSEVTYFIEGDEAQALIKPGLYEHGGFSWVDAGQLSGVVRPYISIVVTTNVDFARLRDVLSVIEGAAWQAGLRPELVNFGVRSVPANLPTQATSTGAPVAYPDQQNRGEQPGASGGEWGIFDDLANLFGVDRKAMLIGAGGALLGVILISKLAR